MNNYLIELNDVTKTFKDQILFSHLSLVVEHHGFYGLEGASGSGKSSLLFILGLLDNDYEGTYLFEGQPIQNKEDILKNQIGFAFQNSVFFNDMTLIENLSLFNEDQDMIEMNYFLERLSLYDKKDTLVRNLSGGERMRLALVRAFLGSPKIVFLDEPTAALDVDTSYKVMNFLKDEAKKRTIFMVSHDASLLRKYVDELYVIENQKIDKLILRKKEGNDTHVPHKKTEGNLSLSFVFKYFKTCFKRRKTNVFLCIFAIFFSLFTIGFSLLLTDKVGEEIKLSFSSLMDQDQVLFEQNDDGKTLEKITISKEEASEMITRNPFFESYGYYYFGDFERQFKDVNECVYVHDGKILRFPSLDLRSLSETVLIEDIPTSIKIYPYRPTTLLNDEGILGLKRSDVRLLAEALSLENTDASSLSNYLEFHSVDLSFCFENKDWNYKNEFPFRLKGFFISDDRPLVAHTNPFYSQYVFETQMRLPFSDDMNRIETLPWTIKRATYIRAKKNQEENALRAYFQGDDYPLYDLEKITSELHPNIFSTYHDRKYMVSYASEGKISYQDALKVSHHDENMLFPIALPYSISKEILTSGFLNTILLSPSSSSLEDIELYYDDLDENIDQIDIVNMDFGEHIASGNLISSALNKGVRLAFEPQEISYGLNADSYHEIEISSSLATLLFSSKELAVNQRIYLSFHQFIDNKNVFKKTSLVVSGVFEDERNLIHQKPFWFQILSVLDLGYDLSDIRVSSYLLKNDLDIETLQALYPSFIFSNPLEDIYQNVDNVLSMLQIILFSFTILLCAASIGILFITIQNTLKDAAKEIGLLKSLGTNKKSMILLYFSLSFLYSFIGLILASLMVIAIDKVLLVFYFEKPFDFSLPLSTLKAMVFFHLVLSLPLIILLLIAPLRKEPVFLLKQYY